MTKFFRGTTYFTESPKYFHTWNVKGKKKVRLNRQHHKNNKTGLKKKEEEEEIETHKTGQLLEQGTCWNKIDLAKCAEWSSLKAISI